MVESARGLSGSVLQGHASHSVQEAGKFKIEALVDLMPCVGPLPGSYMAVFFFLGDGAPLGLFYKGMNSTCEGSALVT